MATATRSLSSSPLFTGTEQGPLSDAETTATSSPPITEQPLLQIVTVGQKILQPSDYAWTTSWRQENNQERTETFLAHGIDLLKSTKLDKAIDVFQKAININIISEEKRADENTIALAYSFLGSAFEKQNKTNKALVIWDEGLRHRHANATTLAVLHGSKASVFFREKRDDEAIKAYQWAIQKAEASTPDEYLAQWHLQLGSVYQRNGLTKFAIDHFFKGIQYQAVHPDTKIELFIELGYTMFLEGRLGEAQLAYEKAISQEDAPPNRRQFAFEQLEIAYVLSQPNPSVP
jgi:tetratricopeptide (TPR) repeat protein